MEIVRGFDDLILIRASDDFVKRVKKSKRSDFLWNFCFEYVDDLLMMRLGRQIGFPVIIALWPLFFPFLLPCVSIFSCVILLWT